MYVQIYKHGEAGEYNTVQEIKAIRTFCYERYGFCGGLKESKDLIDSVYGLQQHVRSEAQKVINIKSAISELSYASIKEIRKYLEVNGVNHEI